MKLVKNKEKSILIKKEANYSAYPFSKRIENIDFSKGNLIYDQNYATNKIDSLRLVELDHDSESAIQLHDSLKTNKKFKNIKNLLYMTSTGYYPTKHVEIGHLYKFFSYNRFEKVRLRLDAQTSLRLSKKIRLHAFGGYGFGDKRWKYGADLSIRTNKQKFNIIKFAYKYDIEQLEITENNQRIGATFGALLRTSPMYKLFYHQNANISWNQEWVDGLSTNISLNLSQFEKITKETFTVKEGSDYLNRQKLTQQR